MLLITPLYKIHELEPTPLFPENCSCMTKSSRKKEKLSKFAKCREGYMITSNSSSQITKSFI